MGGWIALHLALRRARPGPGAGRDRRRARLHRMGLRPTAIRPSDQGRLPRFWESGQRLLLLGGEIAIDCPVRLVHGERDGDVPLDIAFRTMRALRSADVQLTIIKGGGHRLSEPHEIDAILRTVAALAGAARLIFAHRRRHCHRRSRGRCLPGRRHPAGASSAARSQAQKRRQCRRGRSGVRAGRPGLVGQGSGQAARMWAAAGNMWIAADQPGKAALALDKALALPGLAGRAARRGPARPRPRRRSAERSEDRPRQGSTRPRRRISDDPFYWYFSAALAIRESDSHDRQAGDQQGADARADRPDDPVRGRPCRPFRRRRRSARAITGSARFGARSRRADRQGGAGSARACSPRRSP